MGRHLQDETRSQAHPVSLCTCHMRRTLGWRGVDVQGREALAGSAVMALAASLEPGSNVHYW